MGTNGVKVKVRDSADLDLVFVGWDLVLVQIVGIDCLYQFIFVIRIPRVSDLCVVFSVVPLVKGLALLVIHCCKVYQEVILFGDYRITPCPTHKSFSIGRNLAGTFGWYANERIPAKNGPCISQHVHQCCGGWNADVKPLSSRLRLWRFDKHGSFLCSSEVPYQSICIIDQSQ